MAKSVSVYEKPTPHIGLPDWYAKQWELRQSADAMRSDAFELRNSGRQIRAETQIRSDWDTSMNNARLADRVRELSRWRELLEKLLERLRVEKNLLKDERSEAERDLENINDPLQISARCISMRDCRRGNELTHDEADIELKKELCLIESTKKLLTDRVQAAWEKLNRLEQVAFKVNLDLEDKRETIEIDKENVELDGTSASISYKPNALVMMNNSRSVPYESWLEHCRYIELLADNELTDTYAFREAMRVMRQRASNDTRAQQDFTDFALRKRINQSEKARNELEWQKLKMEREMDLLGRELTRLEEALMAKTVAVKCAETRLENRGYRPGFELCRDESQRGLGDEILQLNRTKEDLTNKINCARASYNGLEALMIKIQRNLEDKQHSLMTDIMCLDIRSTLKKGDRKKLTNETDRNIALTGMEQQIPPEPY